MAKSVLISAGGEPIPDGSEVGILEAHDGVELRAARWPAHAGVPVRGTAVVFTGRTEFIEKYFDVVERLRARGFGVVTFDWRGQGLSDRMLSDSQRGYVRRFEDFVQDAVMVRDAAAGDMPGPFLLVAHSMGGNVAVRVLQEHPDRFQRAVLCAPMTGLRSGMPNGLVRAISGMACLMGLGGSYAMGQGAVDPEAELFEANVLTSDPSRFGLWKAYVEADTDLLLGGVTWRWLREAARSIGIIMDPKRIGAIRAPVLLASAGQEELVSTDSHEQFARLSPTTTLVRFPDARHEILQECEAIRTRFWDKVDRFMATNG